MTVNKKKLIVVAVVVIILFSFNNITYAYWEKSFDSKSLDNRNKKWQIWNENNGFYQRELILWNNVSLGGDILIAYEYSPMWDINDKNEHFYHNTSVLKEKYKEYYPINFIKLVYSGSDNSGNVYLKVYKGQNSDNNLKKLYKNINSWLDTDMEKHDKKNTVFYQLKDYFAEYEEYNEYVIDSDKIIKFSNELLPSLMIDLNNEDSTISVKIL
ncbi:MAG: hypothetical protein ACQEQF_09995 [Bacillota bacterium]